MKKWELLKYAYDNYPKGTKFKSLHSGIEFKSTGNISFIEGLGILNIPVGDGIIYDNGIWAEIVTDQQSASKHFIISEDGETLYDGDKYFHVHQVNGIWKLNKSFEPDYALALCSTSKVITDTDHNKAFSKYDAAVSFIASQMVVISANSSYPIHVTRDSIIVQTKNHDPGENLVFSVDEMEECVTTYNILNNEGL